MRWIIMAATAMAGGCIIVGCNSTLDEKMAKVREKAQIADSVFVAGSKTFIGGAEEMATKKHQLQAQVIDTTWTAWLASHTDKNGVLTIDIKTLTDAMNKREEAKRTLEASQKGWEKYVRDYRDAIVAYEAMAAAVWSEEQDVMEAKRTTQAALNQGLTALGALGAGIGVAAMAF